MSPILPRRTGLALLLASIALAGCNGAEKEGGNTAEVEMRDMEMVDGTINDAMTDLDGVQTETAAMSGNTANEAETGNGTVPTMPQAQTEADSAADDQSEVVADQ